MKFIHTARGKYLFSILLGFGLATLFRKSCNSRNCLIFKAPNLDNIKDKIFNHNNKCYQFNEESTNCNNTNSDSDSDSDSGIILQV